MKRNCTEEEVLVDYLEGRLSKRERWEVERHLTECDACLEEAVITKEIIQTVTPHKLDAVPENVTRRTVEAVMALKHKSLLERASEQISLLVSRWSKVLTESLPRRGPSLAPVRGSKIVISDDLILLNKSFSDLAVEIEIEKLDQQRASILVKLSKDYLPAKPIRVTLFRDGREISSYLFTGFTALFEDISFGHYTLVFSRDGQRVGEYPFEIKETRHGG